MYLIHCKIFVVAVLLNLDVFTFIEADPLSHRTNSSQNQQEIAVPQYQPVLLDIKRHNPEKFYYIEDHVTKTFSFFPIGQNIIYKVTKEHHVIWESDNITYSDRVTVIYGKDGRPKARVNFITHLPYFKYIDLYLDIMESTESIHYETYENKHYFIPKFSYLIKNVYMGGRCVWSYNSGDYPEEVVLTVFPDRKPKLKVLFPRDDIKKDPHHPSTSALPSSKQDPRYISQTLHDAPVEYSQPLQPAEALGEPQAAKSWPSPEQKPREQPTIIVREETSYQEPEESGARVSFQPVSHKPEEPPKITVKLTEPTKEPESRRELKSRKEAEPDFSSDDFVSIKVDSQKHTRFYDYFEHETSGIYQLRDHYKLISIRDENNGIIWKSKSPNHYAIKAVRNGIGTNTGVSKASIFLVNGKIIHFIKSNDKWEVRDNDVSLNISRNHSNFEYDYTCFEKSEYFEAKYNFRFKFIKESDITIWEADEKEHANTAIVTKMDNGDRILVVHLRDPYLKLFKQQTGGSWVLNKDFVPVPTHLDIKRPKRTEYDVFTNIAKQGYLFNKIKDDKKFVWLADSPAHYAKRVVDSGIEKDSIVVTIHQLNGDIKKLFKSANSTEFMEIDSTAQIPVTININSVTNCRAYYNHTCGNVRVIRVRDDFIIAGIREKKANGKTSKMIWRANTEVTYVERIEITLSESEVKDIILFHLNGKETKIVKQK